MLAAKRDIDSVLHFRDDISPFLVHLTKSDEDGTPASVILESILLSMQLIAGKKGISDARFGYDAKTLLNDSELERKYFAAVSFTETPLNEIHNLLEIASRRVNLEPYGLVFLKDSLSIKGVSPVIYLNNIQRDKDGLVRALCKLIKNNPNEAVQILPYIAIFGKRLAPAGGVSPYDDYLDFTWEREWRFASTTQTFNFEQDDVFIGLCPNDEIDYFEQKFRWLKFVDPRRNMKWYAERLIAARKRAELKHSVV
jgi:hypothetical protein